MLQIWSSWLPVMVPPAPTLSTQYNPIIYSLSLINLTLNCAYIFFEILAWQKDDDRGLVYKLGGTGTS